MHLDDEAVHYVFRDADGVGEHVDVLRATARSITHVGWGIDLVAGDASTELDGLAGERWLPGRVSDMRLRCPVAGTFEALERKHAQFLSRLDGDTFRPVSPLTTFDVRNYARDFDAVPRPLAAFRLLDPRAGTRLSFETPRRSRDIAAWLRHTVSEAAKGWPFGPTAAVVHGHGDPHAVAARFSFLPLPTIGGPQGVTDIARAAIVAGPGLEEQLAWIKAHVAGSELVWQGRTMALLEPLPATDGVLQRYTATTTDWTTVTPVVLPGYDDESPRKAERLLRKAFLQAGFDPAVVEAIQALDWRKVPFLRGAEHARHYALPDKVQGPAYHVAVRFARTVRGPFAIGSGRHRGMGLFAGR
jgi:CRISPR-associated protein Csb2